MDPFHISEVLRNGSSHSWVNVYSGEWEMAADIIFVFPFVLTAKENNPL